MLTVSVIIFVTLKKGCPSLDLSDSPGTVCTKSLAVYVARVCGWTVARVRGFQTVGPAGLFPILELDIDAP